MEFCYTDESKESMKNSVFNFTALHRVEVKNLFLFFFFLFLLMVYILCIVVFMYHRNLYNRIKSSFNFIPFFFIKKIIQKSLETCAIFYFSN